MLVRLADKSEQAVTVDLLIREWGDPIVVRSQFIVPSLTFQLLTDVAVKERAMARFYDQLVPDDMACGFVPFETLGRRANARATAMVRLGIGCRGSAQRRQNDRSALDPLTV